MKYAFIAKHQDEYHVRVQCQALGVSHSGYYAWRARQKRPKNTVKQALVELIQGIHHNSHGTYGSPRVCAELRASGKLCNHKQVARLMREAGLSGRRKGRKAYTTQSKHPYPVAPNLLNRQFITDAPNTKWVADITYIPTREGWLYLAAVMDLFSRKIVGWEMSAQLTTTMVEQALRMALFERQPARGLLYHSDRGSQYASAQIQASVSAHHGQLSMSRTGNSY